MNKIKMNIWGRQFELPVVIKQFKGKEITDTQRDSYEKFTCHLDIVNSTQNYMEEYILENGGREHGADKVDNIFKYIIPKSIYVSKTSKRIVAVLCDYKYDMEHGVAIIFENEKLKSIGPQDLIL